MRVLVESRDTGNKMVQLKGSTVKDLLDQLGLISENYVAVRNGRIVLADERLKAEDAVKLVPVISGG